MPLPETVDDFIAAKIKEWSPTDYNGLLRFVYDRWAHGYGKIRLNGVTLEFVTGGWSDNEFILGAMRETFFWRNFWESSHRGGMVVFEISESLAAALADLITA